MEVEPWTYIATYTQQINLVAGGPNTYEHLADFEMIDSDGEDAPLKSGIKHLGAAYTFVRSAEGENAHLFSMRAVFDFGGGVEFGR